MRNQDTVTGFFENSGHGIDDDFLVKGARIRRHGAEKLILRSRIFRNGRIIIVTGPLADAEVIEPELVVRTSRDGRCYSRATCPAAARFIDEIGLVAFFQENILEAVAAVRRCFPGLGRLAVAVQEDHAVMMSILRFLIKDIGMVAVQRFAGIVVGSVVPL